MVENPAASLVPPTISASSDAQGRRVWTTALLLSLAILAGLDWILVRILSLPFYAGLFGYLVAGLLAGALSFRIARAARPLSKRRIVVGVINVAVLAGLVSIYWEYEHVSTTIADPPKFADARNAAIRAGRTSQELRSQGQQQFRERLRQPF